MALCRNGLIRRLLGAATFSLNLYQHSPIQWVFVAKEEVWNRSISIIISFPLNKVGLFNFHFYPPKGRRMRSGGSGHGRTKFSADNETLPFNPFPNKPGVLCVCSTSFFFFFSFKNTVGKGEIARYEFGKFGNFLPFSSNLKLSSANSFSLEEYKICCLERVKLVFLTFSAKKKRICRWKKIVKILKKIS